METAIRHRLQKNAETKCSKEMLGLSTGEQLKDLINSYHKVLKQIVFISLYKTKHLRNK